MFLIEVHFNGCVNGTVMFLIGEHLNDPSPPNEWYRNIPNRGAPSPIMLLIGVHCDASMNERYHNTPNRGAL